MLHLARAAAAKHRAARGEPAAAAGAASPPGSPSPSEAPPREDADQLAPIVSFFFHDASDFEEVRAFTREEAKARGLSLRTFHCEFRAGLEQLVSGGVRAILLGTREGDPDARGQETLSPSSAGWPPFLRVNPILSWSYADVWSFLRGIKVPYCSLYDRGYASLGARATTAPVEALRRADGTYSPAWALADARLERAGRAATRAGAAAGAVRRRLSVPQRSRTVEAPETCPGPAEAPQAISPPATSPRGEAGTPVTAPVAEPEAPGEGGASPRGRAAAPAPAPAAPQPTAEPSRSAVVIFASSEALSHACSPSGQIGFWPPLALDAVLRLGWKVRSVSVLPSDVDTVRSLVHAASSESDAVLVAGSAPVAGSLSPAVVRGVALALDAPLVGSGDAALPGGPEVRVLARWSGEGGAETERTPLVVRCRNVYVLPADGASAAAATLHVDPSLGGEGAAIAAAARAAPPPPPPQSCVDGAAPRRSSLDAAAGEPRGEPTGADAGTSSCEPSGRAGAATSGEPSTSLAASALAIASVDLRARAEAFEAARATDPFHNALVRLAKVDPCRLTAALRAAATAAGHAVDLQDFALEPGQRDDAKVAVSLESSDRAAIARAEAALLEALRAPERQDLPGSPVEVIEVERDAEAIDDSGA